MLLQQRPMQPLQGLDAILFTCQTAHRCGEPRMEINIEHGECNFKGILRLALEDCGAVRDPDRIGIDVKFLAGLRRPGNRK
jgi:hypothetical protein